MVKIIYQQVTEDGKFILGLEGLFSDTKPTGGVIADGSTFKETDTDGKYYLDTTWKVAKAGQMKNLPTVSVSDNGKIPKVIEGAWGLGTDETGGSSYTLPTASASTKGGVKIGSGLSMDGEVLSVSGGAEKFVVTLTEDDSGAETVWTADKTIAEIVAADAANQVVVAKYPDESVYVELPLNVAVDTEEVSGAVFVGLKSGGSESSIVSVTCFNQGGEDAIQVEETPIPTSSNAPLIVTLTADQSTGNIVGDKTFGEVWEAVSSGRMVALFASTLGQIIPTFVGLSDDEYLIETQVAGFEQLKGAANDYIALTGD